jgi:hypothetical protein
MWPFAKKKEKEKSSLEVYPDSTPGAVSLLARGMECTGTRRGADGSHEAAFMKYEAGVGITLSITITGPQAAMVIPGKMLWDARLLLWPTSKRS